MERKKKSTMIYEYGLHKKSHRMGCKPSSIIALLKMHAMLMNVSCRYPLNKVLLRHHRISSPSAR